MDGRSVRIADLGFEAPRLEPTQSLFKATLNAMPAHVAILDGEGRIHFVNKSWHQFLKTLNISIFDDGVGAEYLGIGILGALDRRRALVLRVALRSLLRGNAERFRHAVCATGNGVDRWYQVSAARFSIDGSIRIAVTHEDTTAIHAAQETIKSLSHRLLNLQEEERRRIAVELHDSTAQQLTAIGLYLMKLRQASAIDAEMEQTLDRIHGLINEAQKEIRDFSYLLHPPYLDRDGLKATLTRFIDGFSRRAGLMAHAQIAEEVDGFTPEVQRTLLRIVQEALSNVHRHACASEVQVRMKTTRNRLVFQISDNGSGMSNLGGIDAPLDRPQGLGLPGMHARMRHLDGMLKVLSTTHGTTIFGKAPLSRCQA
jgi:signal transduction histidine kinase